MGGGGLQNWRGGGACKVLALLKGGTTSYGVVFIRKVEVLAILNGGGGGGGLNKVSTLKKNPQNFPLFKIKSNSPPPQKNKKNNNVLSCLRGGGRCKGFGPLIFPLCSTPSP